MDNLADRYTTSNMVHQAAKIRIWKRKTAFLTGCGTLNLRFITPGARLRDISGHAPSFSRELMKERANKFTGEQKKDIHERNDEYLVESYRILCMLPKIQLD